MGSSNEGSHDRVTPHSERMIHPVACDLCQKHKHNKRKKMKSTMFDTIVVVLLVLWVLGLVTS